MKILSEANNELIIPSDQKGKERSEIHKKKKVEKLWLNKRHMLQEMTDITHPTVTDITINKG